MLNVSKRYIEDEIRQGLPLTLQCSERIPHSKRSRMRPIQIQIKANMTEQVNFIIIECFTSLGKYHIQVGEKQRWEATVYSQCCVDWKLFILILIIV